MGMDAYINGNEVRFSKLLAEVAYQRFPYIADFINKNGYLELNKHQVASICTGMIEELNKGNIIQLEPSLQLNVGHLRLNLEKLSLLLIWLDQSNSDDILTFC